MTRSDIVMKSTEIDILLEQPVLTEEDKHKVVSSVHELCEILDKEWLLMLQLKNSVEEIIKNHGGKEDFVSRGMVTVLDKVILEMLKNFGEEKSPVKRGGSYTDPVKFTSTDNFGCGPEDEDDVYTVEEFKEAVKSYDFIDDDGHGYPVRDGKADRTCLIYPSIIDEIPEDATHIVWYNK